MLITKHQLQRYRAACSVLSHQFDDNVWQYDEFRAGNVLRALERIVEDKGLLQAYQDKLNEIERAERKDIFMGRVR